MQRQTPPPWVGCAKPALIVLGKTNSPEASSSGETDNAIFGRTNHPLDLTRTPGGSSGGEAAILGADASVAGVGTDGGSSIRAPSHFCGTIGLRPTAGRTPETGVWPPTRATGMLDLTCVGPMGRFVDDVALLLGVMAGPDDIDPFATPVPLGDHARVQLAGLRVAVYDSDGSVRVTPGTSRAVKMAGAALERAGATVVEVEPVTLFRDATEVFFGALAADGGANLIEHCQGEFARHPQFQALIDGFASQAPSAREAYRRHARLIDFRRMVRRFLADFDLVVCPVVCGPAPRHGCPPAGVSEERYMSYEAYNFCHTYAVAGLPSVSVPVTTEDAMPVGVQVVSRAFAEDVALAGAAAVNGHMVGSMSSPIVERAGRRCGRRVSCGPRLARRLPAYAWMCHGLVVTRINYCFSARLSCDTTMENDE